MEICQEGNRNFTINQASLRQWSNLPAVLGRRICKHNRVKREKNSKVSNKTTLRQQRIKQKRKKEEDNVTSNRKLITPE